MPEQLMAPLPPIRRSVAVSWDRDTTFRRFTADFADWWPRGTHSIGGKRVKRIVFEGRVGGRIYEELDDGRRFQWGKLTAWEPVERVAFIWHPSLEERQAQDVEIRFVPEGTRTRVELVSSGWERMGAKARRQRKGYDIGWGSVLDVYASRWSAVVANFAVISRVITFFLRVTGKPEASIDKAGGLPANSG